MFFLVEALAYVRSFFNLIKFLQYQYYPLKIVSLVLTSTPTKFKDKLS